MPIPQICENTGGTPPNYTMLQRRFPLEKTVSHKRASLLQCLGPIKLKKLNWLLLNGRKLLSAQGANFFFRVIRSTCANSTFRGKGCLSQGDGV